MRPGLKNSFRRATALLVLVTVFPVSALGAPTTSKTSGRGRPKEAEAEAIPKTPSAPAFVAPVTPVDPFRCERNFTHKGEVLGCDSNIRLDGEKLRPIVQSVPEAAAELDLYQRNRLSLRNAAYIGTLGVVVMIAGSLLSLNYRENGVATDTSNAIRQISLIGGGTIAAGGFLYGLSANQGNETHLQNAVGHYNKANPQTPIQLQFSTGMTF